MASLADLFNPSFLALLGILVLVVALLVLYFESKIREQNHKISSMLSLVSTLAEDMNGVKIGFNHLALRTGQNLSVPLRENLGNIELISGNLIEVSDGEESESESEDEDEDEQEDEDEESSTSQEDEDDDYEDEEVEEDIKVVKLLVSNEDLEDDASYEEANNLEFDVDEELDSELDADILPEITNNYVGEVLELNYDIEPEQLLEGTSIPSSSDLKTISINLGEENEDSIDYKKLQLAKLRSIVVEKGLTNNSDAAKLKKPDLLKLLGSE
jgi:hypothetical protein